MHVLLMVGTRKLVYAARGQTYAFGDWLREMLYEGIKDVRAYALFRLWRWATGYRLLLWRWQGEWTLLQPPDEAAAPVQLRVAPYASEPPERFLVEKLGKEFLLPTREIEWLQSSGNYVNLHRIGHDFFRVHRSYLVNVAMVASIEPIEFGDARLRLHTGASLPCSRSYLEALRQRLV